MVSCWLYQSLKITCWIWFLVWCLISFSVSFSLSEHIIRMVLFPATSQTRGNYIGYSSSYFKNILQELFSLCKASNEFYIGCTPVKAGSHLCCLGATLLRKIWRTTVSPSLLKATRFATLALVGVLPSTWWERHTAAWWLRPQLKWNHLLPLCIFLHKTI